MLGSSPKDYYIDMLQSSTRKDALHNNKDNGKLDLVYSINAIRQ